MKMVIGGAYQGKLGYAQKNYNITEGWIDGSDCSMEDIFLCRGIHHFHEYVKRMIREEGKQERADDAAKPKSVLQIEQEADAFAELLCRKNPGIVIVTNELGYGIVPLEKTERIWRETAGRICTALAVRAEEVVRVVCGIGTVIKGESK